MGIKEIKELLEALSLLAVTGKKIAADGKISVDDISHLISLSAQLDVLVEGVKDIDKALDEAKNLDQAEVLEIIGKLYDITKKINEA